MRWPPGEDEVVLAGGRFVDVRAKTAMPEGTRVFVKAGRIVDVGRARYGEAPTIDLRGRWVVPALVNTHGHLQLVTPGLCVGAIDLARTLVHRSEQIEAWMLQCLEAGVGTVQDSATHGLARNADLARRIAGGVIPGPAIQQAVLVAPEGGAFSPPRSVKSRIAQALTGIHGADYGDTASGILTYPPGAGTREVREAVDRAIDERGADVIKLYDQKERSISYVPGATVMTQEQLDAAVDQARVRGVPSAMHHVDVESFRRGVRAGVGSLVHVAMDAPLTEKDVRDLLAAGCTCQPTLTLAWCYSWDLAGMACHGHPRAARLSAYRRDTCRATLRDHWIEALFPVSFGSFERPARARMRLAGQDVGHIFRYWSGYVSQGMDNVRLIAEHGGIGRLACGSDHGAAWCGPSLVHVELDMLDLCLNEQGERLMTPADALRIATFQGALATGLEQDIGTIEPGRRADLAVVGVDPLSDRAVLGRPVEAFIQGGRVVVDRCGLDRDFG